VHGPGLIRRLLQAGWPANTLMNVNFPGRAAQDVAGIAFVPQGTYDLQSTEILERQDARGRSYYWVGLRRRGAQQTGASDLGAVAEGKISITPLHMNLTDPATLEKMRAALGQI
jgi:5'-nucleotidase